MFEIKNLGQVIDQINAWEADVHELTLQVARGYAAVAFEYLLEHSPQYSGDFAANWKYSLNAPDTSFVPDILGGSHEKHGTSTDKMGFKAFIMGARPAIEAAIRYNAGRDEGFKLGDTVYFSNSAQHDEMYAWLIEDNKIKFRPGNAGATVAKAATAMMQEYPILDKKAAKALAGRRI